MKRISSILVLPVLLLATLSLGAAAQTARLQVVHNAADPAAAVVDVYVNGDLFLDDFAFRTATPFVDVPAEVTLSIGVAPGSSGGPEDILATFDVVLADGERYVVMANGVLDPAGFAANPDGLDIGFNLFPRDGVREQTIPWLVKVLAFHGAYDAPTVDILRTTNWGPRRLFDDLSYGDFSGYRVLFPRSYVLQVTPGGDNDTVVAEFEADLTGLGGGAAVVFASGFLDPDANQGGAAFGLFAALPDGNVVEFPAVAPPAEVAELQVIHNAADPGAAVVDVWVNGGLLLDDFAFRTATPFVEVPAGVTLTIGVAPPDSDEASDALAEFDVVLETGERYVVMANGVLDPDGFAANPDGLEIGFNLYPLAGVAADAPCWLVRLYAFHGATDAPTVDIVRRGHWASWPIFDDLSYGEWSDSRYLLPRRYTLDVTPGDDNDTVVASYEADLRGLGGATAVAFASGFLSPDDDQGGEAFGLFVALADGSVIALPSRAHADDLPEAVASRNPVAAMPFALDQNFPNPFNPRTTIAFSLPAAEDVSLKVYDARGRMVKSLVDGPLPAGAHSVTLDATNLSSGVYFYRLQAGEQVEIKRMTLLR